jgi:hypothetical protein
MTIRLKIVWSRYTVEIVFRPKRVEDNLGIGMHASILIPS